MRLVLIILLISKISFGQQSEEIFKKGIESYISGNYLMADSLFTLAIFYSSKTNSTTFENYYNRAMERR